MEQRIFSFCIKEQLMVMLQNVNDVNKIKKWQYSVNILLGLKYNYSG